MVELSVEVLLGVAAISFGINWVAFVIAYALQTEKFYDIVGSATYVSCIWFSIAYAGIWNARQLVVSVMVTIWTVRLGVFLFVRVLKTGALKVTGSAAIRSYPLRALCVDVEPDLAYVTQGDSRFEAMLKQPLNYFIAWTLQGVWVFVNLLGVVLLNATRKNPDFNAADIIGGGLWLLGFLCEAVADQQKFNFKMNPENRGKFISTGLWRWSRYPNYFGEMCIWWGVFIFVAPSLRDWEFVAVAGPLFTMFLLLAVSGIPLQEKQRNDRWGTDPEYQEYLKQSNLLIPLPITACCGSSKTASEASNEASLSPGRA